MTTGVVAGSIGYSQPPSDLGISSSRCSGDVGIHSHQIDTCRERRPNNIGEVGITDGRQVLSRCLVNPSHQIVSSGVEVDVGFKVEGGDIVASILMTLHCPPYLEEACCCSQRERLASSSWS